MRNKIQARVWVIDQGFGRSRLDHLAAEEPLEIRLVQPHRDPPRRTLAVTMRTPGHDFELAAGFLFGEGVIQDRSDIISIRYCLDPEREGIQRYNIVNVELRPGLEPDLGSLERHFFTTSACGVCGKASLESLALRHSFPMASGPFVPPQVLTTLPEKLRQAQGIFTATGGLHAAALFNAQGSLVLLREDVGRHNALDKLIGAALLGGTWPLDQSLVLVSGRASFELLQKCLAARVPIVCAISAPSSLAVEVATQFGMTLVGFLRGERMNVYSGIDRIPLEQPDPTGG